METEGTEKEAAEIIKAVLYMEVEEEGKGEKEGDGTIRSLGDIEFLNQEADPTETTLVDACNGFNKLSRLTMLWTVWHSWPSGARFPLNCYMYWAQLLVRPTGETPVNILIQEGATQGDPFLMVFYRTTLAPPG